MERRRRGDGGRGRDGPAREVAPPAVEYHAPLDDEREHGLNATEEELYDHYLDACLTGEAEDPDAFCARFPAAGW